MDSLLLLVGGDAAVVGFGVLLVLLAVVDLRLDLSDPEFGFRRRSPMPLAEASTGGSWIRSGDCCAMAMVIDAFFIVCTSTKQFRKTQRVSCTGDTDTIFVPLSQHSRYPTKSAMKISNTSDLQCLPSLQPATATILL